MVVEFVEDAPPSERSLSQDELIAEFTRIAECVKELQTQKAVLAFELAGLARAKKQDQNTVHLQSTGGAKVDVVFGTETEYNNEELLEVSKMIGKEEFDKLFKVKIEFTANKRALKLFLNTVYPDEKFETAKQMIQDATYIKDKLPYVSIPKPKASGG